jgi:hypothetical protein
MLTTTTEVTDVETGPIPDATFAVPEGYRRIEFGAGG